MTPHRKFMLPLLIAVVCVVVATLGYMLLEGWSLGEAVYMAVIVLSTTGLKEVHEMDPRGLAWTVIVIVFGAASLATAYALITSAIVSGELRRVLGRRTLQNKINQLSRHILICGYGRMGEMITADLTRRGAQVVVVDKDPAKTARLEEAGVLYVLGDASEEDTLRRAGIMKARGLVSVLPEDSANVFVTLTARGFRDDITIITRAEQTSTEPKLRRAGASRVICPTVIGASRVAALMMQPHVADFIEVTARGVELEVDEYRVTAISPLKGQTLSEAQLRQKADVMVVAVTGEGGKTLFSPGADHAMKEGDTLILIGPPGLAARLQSLDGGG
jgi:voltage-gated potassium channel